jgi:hypothetical protein
MTSDNQLLLLNKVNFSNLFIQFFFENFGLEEEFPLLEFIKLFPFEPDRFIF